MNYGLEKYFMQFFDYRLFEMYFPDKAITMLLMKYINEIY
jgi:hypothetical protein